MPAIKEPVKSPSQDDQKESSKELVPQGQGQSQGQDKDSKPKLSTARRPPANVGAFVYDPDSMKETSSFSKATSASRSLELAPDYEKAKEALERATENATFNFTKRRGIAGEIKQYKEQKSEAERFEALCQERDELVLRRILVRLYHIQRSLEEHARAIKEQNQTLAGLRAEQRKHENLGKEDIRNRELPPSEPPSGPLGTLFAFYTWRALPEAWLHLLLTSTVATKINVWLILEER
ncbi:hypothetical protein NUW54_g14387 [Trametes sanguinea]|uniref:Uncharacterized protein n=1 Tax=Trametes sanguinea TaxID=158606 RepID=A0ACC1MDE4_9APHY|nr:hypothetical protein NUW54_g14387 [Trametes sanguinea]